MEKFLGRKLDPNTMTYSFSDGSGGIITEEDRQELLTELANPVQVRLDISCEMDDKSTYLNEYSNINALGKLFEIKKRALKRTPHTKIIS